MPAPTLTYTCRCGARHVLRIIAHEAPPIPYDAWPDDSWYIHDEDPDNHEGAACKQCDEPLPVLLFNIDRGNRPSRFALTADAMQLSGRKFT